MPCRVVLVEYGDGRRYLVTMDMTLALYGGTDKKPINPDLFEDMLNVKKRWKRFQDLRLPESKSLRLGAKPLMLFLLLREAFRV